MFVCKILNSVRRSQANPGSILAAGLGTSRCRLFATLMLLAAGLVTASAGVAPTATTSVTLAWDRSVSPNVTQYKVYYGTVSGAYTNAATTGGTQLTLSNLVANTRYYFAATSINSSGLESVFSEEISYVPTLKAKMKMSLNSTKRPLLTVNGPAGYSYDIETASSAQSTTWTKIGTVTLDATGLGQFTDTTAATAKSKFYRLRQTVPAL